MQESLKEAFWLLFVGMGSVFFILYLIGLSGNYLIIWVNTLSGNEGRITKTAISSDDAIKPANVAVITSVVHQMTAGKGKIESIHKIES